MIKINIILNNKLWYRYIKNPSKFLEHKVSKLNKLNKKYKKNNIIFTVLLSGNSEIRKLNKRFRNKNNSTDVLSFPFYKKEDLNNKLKKEKEIYLGDVIVNINKINKKKGNKNFKAEFDKLWVHGLVHLFGYDHKKVKDYNLMIKVEKKFLSYLI